jgi:hypothetical protein
MSALQDISSAAMKPLMLALFFGSFCSMSYANAETPESVAKQASITLELARKGGYGPMSERQLNMIQESYARLEALAAQNKTMADLDSEELERLRAARERIERLTKSADANRIVCKRAVKTGTRLIKAECLTVAERERRARGARERTERLQNQTCPNGALLCGAGG